MNRNSKKMLKLAVSIGMIVLGVYMTFFRDVGTNKVRNTDLQTEQQGEQQMEEQAMIRDKHDYSMTTELPDEENLSESDTFNKSDTFNREKKDVYVYFENTAELDAGNLPLQAQAELAVNIQTYLERSGYGDVTELYINNYTEDGQNITIQCNMDGYADELLIEYDGGEKHLSYCIVKN